MSRWILDSKWTLRPGKGTAAPTVVCKKCLWSWRLAGSSSRVGCAHSGQSPFHCPWRQGMVFGGSGDPNPCVLLNNGTSFPRQTMLPLGHSWLWSPSLPYPLLYPCSQQWSSPWIHSLNSISIHRFQISFSVIF